MGLISTLYLIFFLYCFGGAPVYQMTTLCGLEKSMKLFFLKHKPKHPPPPQKKQKNPNKQGWSFHGYLIEKIIHICSSDVSLYTCHISILIQTWLIGHIKGRLRVLFSGLTANFLQAIVIVRFPINIGLVEGLVGVCAVHGGFNSWILPHALCPLLQLRCTIQTARRQRK